MSEKIKADINLKANRPVMSSKLLKEIEAELDDLIEVIDHRPDEIDSYTTVNARRLLKEISKYTN